MWVKVALHKARLCLTCCYIPPRGFDHYNLYDLDHCDSFSDVFASTLIHEKIRKILVMEDFNGRV